jgi:hypothetical protein
MIPQIQNLKRYDFRIAILLAKHIHIPLHRVRICSKKKPAPSNPILC